MNHKTVRAMLPILYAFAYRRRVEYRDSRPGAKHDEWTAINPDTTEFRLGDDTHPGEWRWWPIPGDFECFDHEVELVYALKECAAALQMICDSGVALADPIEKAMTNAIDCAERLAQRIGPMPKLGEGMA